VITLDPEVNNSKAVLKGSFLSSLGEVEEYGFVWDALSNPDYSKRVIKFDSPLQKNADITAELYDLDLEQAYYVRAYAKQGSDIFYGAEKSFIFGGLVPEVTSLVPTGAHWGDTIQIIGKNFTTRKDRVSVQFDDMLSNIVAASSDTILCVVPVTLSSTSLSVKVRIGNESSVGTSFSLLKPEIVNFTPESATYQDLLIIKGNNFHSNLTSNKVRFGEVTAEVVKATSSSLTVRVPVDIVASPATISVQVDSQRVYAEHEFRLLPMSVSGIWPTLERIGNIVTISGSNFNPSAASNDVFFGANKADVVEGSKTQLKVRVPNGIYDDHIVTVTVKVSGIEQQGPDLFTIENAWIRKADIYAGKYGRWGAQGFVIDGTGYAGLGAGAGVSSAYQDFYKFDNQNNSWTRVADFGGGKRYWTASFVIDGFAYVGTGSQTMSGEGSNDFYKYDPSNDTWTRVADFPGNPVTRAIGFSVNGKGYLCTPTTENNFWEYDPTDDVWKEKAVLVTSPWGGPKKAVGAFVLANHAYVLTSEYSRGELYEYDFHNDAWIRKNDVSDMGNIPSVVSTQTHAYYIRDYSVLEYNMNSDSWKSVEFDPVPARYDAFSFGIGSAIYIGGGRDNNYSDFWECDTSKLY
jgi:N-acetylneuraminic acid mutarotase